jgi:hypothetical protein
MRRALALLLAALTITSLAAQGQRFTVAIVRPDGGIVPFAAYNAGRWERAWPEADEATDARSIDSVPSVWGRRGGRVPDVWRVWPASGVTPIDARVSGLEVAEAHCSSQVALKTNLPKASVEHPLKFGIAVDSSTVPVGVIGDVRRSDAIWTAAERAVLAIFRNWKPRRRPEIGNSCRVRLRCRRLRSPRCTAKSSRVCHPCIS